MWVFRFAIIGLILFSLALGAFGQTLPREQWGAPAVEVSHTNGQWTIKGKQNTVTLNESDLALKVQSGATVWQMTPSSDHDMLVRSKGKDTNVRLADAQKRTITNYDTGFKRGVKIVLSGWPGGTSGEAKAAGTSAVPVTDLSLVLTVCFEGK